MAKTRYGVPYWPLQVPPSKVARYPALKGDRETDVVIAGGGFVGCATAYACAAAGVNAIVIESDRIGLGASAASSALLMQEPDVDFVQTADQHGLRAARRMWQMTRRGMLDCAATIRRLRIKTRLTTQDSLYVSASERDAKVLRRELEARRDAGLEASWMSPEKLRRAAGLEAAGAIRMAGNAQVDPYRLCLGFIAAAARRGTDVYERTPLVKARADRDGVTVFTPRGEIRARRLVVAANAPPPAFRSLARHFERRETYAVLTPPLPADVRRAMGRRDAMVWDTAAPCHYLRWMEDDRILFGGADQPPPPPRLAERALRQRAGQLMYELSLLYPVISGIQPEYAWSGVVAASADGWPRIGAHRNYPHHLFALGFGGAGLALGFLASRILVRAHLDAAEKGDELFGFAR